MRQDDIWDSVSASVLAPIRVEDFDHRLGSTPSVEMDTLAVEELAWKSQLGSLKWSMGSSSTSSGTSGTVGR
jgi:hypothetical protein